MSLNQHRKTPSHLQDNQRNKVLHRKTLSSQRALRSPLVVLMRGIIQIKRGIRLQIINQILRMDTALAAMEEMRLVQAMCSERAIRQVQEMLRQAFTGDTERPMGPMEGFLLLPVLLMRLWAIALRLRDGVLLHPPLRWARLLSSHLNRMDGLLESWWLWHVWYVVMF